MISDILQKQKILVFSVFDCQYLIISLSIICQSSSSQTPTAITEKGKDTEKSSVGSCKKEV